MRPFVRLARVPFLALLAAVGCGGGDALGPLEPLSSAEPRFTTRAEMEAARTRWRARGISSYELQYREQSAWCCQGRIRIQVREGTVTTVASDEPLGWLTESPGEFFAQATVEGFFARLEQAFDGGAATVRATYDPRLGVPTRAGIDYRIEVADDEVGWAVDALRRAR